MSNRIKESELILNEDGSIYHLHLQPEEIADTIITVGDPDRVPIVSKYFDRIEHKIQKREFFTHTGYIGKKRISVISTGIGTDNIDIVVNELDALVNIDLETRLPKEKLTSLKLVRVGTSGSLQENVPIDSILLSTYGLGLDGMLNFYDIFRTDEEQEILELIKQGIPELPIIPELVACSPKLLQLFHEDYFERGITVTSTGFYGPQGRVLRAKTKVDGLIDKLSCLKLPNARITNLEMETAAIYGLGRQLGHECLAVNVILANRQLGTFSTRGAEIVDKAIQITLEKLSS